MGIVVITVVALCATAHIAILLLDQVQSDLTVTKRMSGLS